MILIVEHPRFGILKIHCEDAYAVSLWLRAHVDATHLQFTVVKETNTDD